MFISTNKHLKTYFKYSLPKLKSPNPHCSFLGHKQNTFDGFYFRNVFIILNLLHSGNFHLFTCFNQLILNAILFIEANRFIVCYRFIIYVAIWKSYNLFIFLIFPPVLNYMNSTFVSYLYNNINEWVLFCISFA